MEETILVKDGISSLPNDRKKTVVYDRLLMKIDRIEGYWKKVEGARAEKVAKIVEAAKTAKIGEKKKLFEVEKK
jgi:hypothetical protein